MPTYSLGIKDSVTSSFKLILNSRKENFQIISAPKFTIVQCEVFLFPLLVIMCYCLHFLCDH